MARPTSELKQLKETVNKLKRLYGLLIDKYMSTLEDGGEVNASMLSEIGKFLSQNGVILGNMVKLDMLESLSELKAELKGDLDSMTSRKTSQSWRKRAEESLKGMDFSHLNNTKERNEYNERSEYDNNPLFSEQLQ